MENLTFYRKVANSNIDLLKKYKSSYLLNLNLGEIKNIYLENNINLEQDIIRYKKFLQKKEIYDKKIIVFFHIFYTDMIDEYLFYLKNIKESSFKFDLYVSICNEKINKPIEDKLKNFKEDVIITICENRGADIGGFISILNNQKIELKNYNSWLFIHTKQSNHLELNRSIWWRRALLNDILLNPELVNICVNKIIDGIGIIGSSRHVELCRTCLDNENEFKRGCKLVNVKPDIESLFIGGTIFWANMKILEKIINSNISIKEFEKNFEHSGLLQHGFERVFGVISKHFNLPVLGIKLNVQNKNYYNNLKKYEYVDNILIIKPSTNFKFYDDNIIINENSRLNILNKINRYKNYNSKK